MTRLPLAAAVAATLAVPALARDRTGPNVMTGAAATGGAVARAALAQELYAYALAEEDMLAALTAAHIEAGLGAAPSDLTPRGGGEAENAPGAAEMFALAEALAAGDPLLEELVDDVKLSRARGRMGGVYKRKARLSGGATDEYEIPFYGERLAEIAVLGDGDSDLNVTITDDSGNAICGETGAADKLYCPFTPAWDGLFVVTVENLGEARNSYVLLTN